MIQNFKLPHSAEKTAQLLEMLKSSKDANMTMRSIPTIITDRKRGKIDHSKTTFNLDSDKQKKLQGKHRKQKQQVITDTTQDTKQNSKTQTPKQKTYSRNMQYNYNIRC